MKCLWPALLKHRFSWSRCTRNLVKYSFCLLMSVAKIKEPRSLSMFKLWGGGHTVISSFLAELFHH